MAVRSILSVLGPWASPDALVDSLDALRAEDGPRFALTGDRMVELVTEGSLAWSWQAPEPRLPRAFELAGTGIRGALLRDLGRARGHVMLIDECGGSTEAARQMMIFGDALLRAGGLAVKVESAGLAHAAEDWREMTRFAHDAAALVSAFVAMVGDPAQGFFTCGMHNLGLPDAVVAPGVEPGEAAELLDSFALYLACEAPRLEEGETFSRDEGEPAWVLERQPCAHLEVGPPRHNPYGMWGLFPG